MKNIYMFFLLPAYFKYCNSVTLLIIIKQNRIQIKL